MMKIKTVPKINLLILIIFLIIIILTTTTTAQQSHKNRRLNSTDVLTRSSSRGGFSIGGGGGRNKTRGEGGISLLRNTTRGSGFNVGLKTVFTTAPPFSQAVTSSSNNVPLITGGTGGINSGTKIVRVGLMLSYSMFMYRDYQRAVLNVLLQLQKYKSRFKFLQEYNFTLSEVNLVMITVSPSPQGN